MSEMWIGGHNSVDSATPCMYRRIIRPGGSVGKNWDSELTSCCYELFDTGYNVLAVGVLLE